MTFADSLIQTLGAAAVATPRRSRAAALLLTAVALLVPVLLLAGPLLGGAAAAWRQAAQQQRALDADRALLARAGAVAAERTELEARRAATLLAGATDALASAALQSDLAQMAAQQGGRLLSAEALPVAADGPLRRLPVRATFDLSAAGLRDLLYRIERAGPALAVTAMTIRPRDPQGRRLDVALTVQGWRAQEDAP